MNKLFISGIILVIIFSICFIGYKSVNSIADQSQFFLSEIENSKDNFEKSKEIYENFKNYWNEKSKILGMLVHHEHLEEIEQDMSELESSLEQKEWSEVDKSCKCAESKFENLKKTYEVSLENII